ncbi:hypothetical protein F3Y22_tig00110319pilonHSYRG00355 [Hibiscus syriacus]|uniref:Uncharacterized protein n=1 Tax=Hibiscus syriacus TaxID=106335 RepID=A0A6A3B678_HIBSY|nr:hypothetical protein F3Y22_tig00110319pilonHSYRG00355 [Hibiscus syriacus]
MKVILRKDGCLAAISERPVDFTDNNKWIEMDGNAMSNFHLALADEVLSSIEEKKTTKEIWDHLTKLYEATSMHNKIFLMRKLYTLQENRRKNKEDRQVNLQQAEALTTMRGRSTERGQSSSHKHGRSKSRSKKNLKCYNCGKKGHLKKDCWSLNKNSNPQGNTANTSEDGDALCCEASTTVEGRKRYADIWLIDSGATYHMTSRREWFHHYKPVSGGYVHSCNDHALEIVGVGTIKLKMYDGTIKFVRDVRHVKGLKKNLLSYRLLDNNASKIETRKGIMKVFRGALVVLKGEKIAANLYMLKGETLLEAEASVASCSSDSAMLWHQKLGHMSEQEMKVLVEQNLLPGLTKVSLTLCEHCITSGAKYFFSFIDDYFRRCWVYPIKKKSDVFSTFKNFKARVELDSGNKIKCFRTDNGEEYTSKEFNDFCRKKGIKRQFTVANTPQQNGVAERMNKTLLERTRSMLRNAGLEKSFWAEAVNTACYLVNRAPSTAIDLKTPMKIWTGKPADYSNLHVFGSIVYVMYNSQEISKLDPKSRKCKFSGYADGVKGYRLWDRTAHKVIINRDVIFVEDKLQRKEDDDNTEKLETTQIHVEKDVEEGDSSEAEPAHDEQEPESFEAPTTRQSDRVRRRPNWHSDYVIEENIEYCLLTEDGEPSTYEEAINNSDASLWMMAMQEEIETLHKNNTWDLVPLPQGRKPIGNKWVFKIKRNDDDQVERYRARLVVKGYAQKEGIDFNEIFSPVVRLTTVRVVLAMCATLNLHLEQLDVKTTFLMEILKKRFICSNLKDLKKKKRRTWFADPCAYFKRSGDNDFVILLLYVDDMLVAGPNKDHIEELKAQLAREFKMKDLGSANKILGMQIHRDRSNRKIWLSQKNYLKKILSRFNMQDCKSIFTPLPINFKLSSSMSPSSEKERMEMSQVPYASAVGSLMFAMICIRPDIAQAVGVVSRDLDKNKSTTGYVFKVAGGAVSWVSKLQSVMATSTIEAEYVAATQASKEAIWLKMLLEELGHNKIVILFSPIAVFHNNHLFNSQVYGNILLLGILLVLIDKNSAASRKAAIDSLSQFASYGGSLLFVPPGKWLTGCFNLTSHFTLYLHKDATILASQDESEWAVIDPLPSNDGMQLVEGENGTVDGQGVTYNVVVQGLTILAPVTSPNTKGIIPDSCTNTRIEDCYIVSGDDCIAVKSGWDHAVIALGSEMSGRIKDVRAEDITGINSESAVRIKTAVGRGNYVKDICEEDDYENYENENVTMAGRLEGIPGHPFSGICISNATIELAKKPKKIQWNCTEISGVSSDVTPKPCNLLMDQGP